MIIPAAFDFKPVFVMVEALCSHLPRVNDYYYYSTSCTVKSSIFCRQCFLNGDVAGFKLMIKDAILVRSVLLGVKVTVDSACLGWLGSLITAFGLANDANIVLAVFVTLVTVPKSL